MAAGSRMPQTEYEIVERNASAMIESLRAFGSSIQAASADLAKTGKDPIQWLEDRIQVLQKTEEPDQDEIELLRQLGRVLDDAGKAKPNPRPPRTKARR